MALRLLPFAPANMSRSLISESLQFRLNRFLPITPIASGFLQPVSISLNIPGFLSDIWESVLRAVPKKKTSHMKKRHRFMAGKALKDVKSLNKCPGCGQLKRAHLLCPHCVKGRIEPYCAGRQFRDRGTVD
jgi:large subunit ribosomal protein L32